VTALNSDLYDHPELYDALLPATAHVNYYVDLARRASGDVLELACGTGQLTVPIGSAGLPALGLDLSPPMLATAANVSVEFVHGDMRNFDLGSNAGAAQSYALRKSAQAFRSFKKNGIVRHAFGRGNNGL
jgi:SAM-dependent methyltransferase